MGQEMCQFLSKNMMLKFRDGFLLTQSAFTCSKLTIEILEQGVKYIQS